MTILDAAMGHASTWCSVEGNVRRCVTLSLNTSFLAIARTRLVRAIGHLESVNGRIATCRAEVVDGNGEVCINGQGSYMYMRGCEKVEGIPAEHGGRSA
jgi:acyl-coenzyme A thioesterase PaaI-like protein